VEWSRSQSGCQAVDAGPGKLKRKRMTRDQFFEQVQVILGGRFAQGETPAELVDLLP
jgi:hypothetical protein